MTSPQACRSPHRNLFSNGKDEFAKGAPTESSNIHSFTLATLCALIPILAPALPSNNKLFQQFMKVY